MKDSDVTENINSATATEREWRHCLWEATCHSLQDESGKLQTELSHSYPTRTNNFGLKWFSQINGQLWVRFLVLWFKMDEWFLNQNWPNRPFAHPYLHVLHHIHAPFGGSIDMSCTSSHQLQINNRSHVKWVIGSLFAIKCL